MEASVNLLQYLTSKDVNEEHWVAIAVMEASVNLLQHITANDVNEEQWVAMAIMEASTKNNGSRSQ